MDDLILLNSYFHKHDAEIVFGLLEEAGIKAILQSDDAGGFRHHLTLGMGNNRILIQKKDAEKAKEILACLHENISEEELQQIEELAVQTKETLPPKRKRRPKKNNSIAIPIVLALIFLLSYVFQETHKEPYNSYKYFPAVNCNIVSNGTDSYNECKEYYKDNKIRWIGKYKGDTPVYDSKGFFQNGQIRWEGIILNGKLNGPAKQYFENGVLHSQGNNKNNKLDGIFIEYYSSGKLKHEIHFKDGELHGNYKTYYENGNLMEDLEFTKGYRYTADGKKYSGIEKTVYENGSIWEEWNYKNGKLDGVSRGFYNNGNIEFEAVYHKGKVNGDEKIYFENGQLQFHSTYKNDIPTYTKEYNREGTVIFESYY
ncbi:MAG: hypothetical protein AB7S78_01410 [Candidatus Omnitrophota bacterium]